MSPLEILERSFRPIEIPSRMYVGCKKCGTALSGVYLLINKDEIVYCGSSIDISTRIYDHDVERRRGKKRNGGYKHAKNFDRVLCLALPPAVLLFYEGALTRALRPRYTKKCPTDSAYDAEILYGLGLRDTLTDDDIAAAEAA